MIGASAGQDIAARAAAIEAVHRATALYTAEPIVDELLAKVDWPRGDRRLVDPSCGDGMFLGRALQKLLALRPDVSDTEIAALIEGWEIYPGAADDARERVAGILIAAGRRPADARALASRMVRTGDFLADGPNTASYGCILANPPYLRYVNVPQVLRREYEARLPAHACSDLLHSFLDRCTAALDADGEIAAVTSDRWLFGQRAAGLRAAIGERLSIHHLERLDSSTAFYRPKQRRAGTPPRVHPVAVVMRTTPGPDVIELSGKPIYPDRPKGEPAAGRTLGDVAEVTIGPYLGTKGIFVVDAEVAKGLPPEALVPAVDARDIVKGVLQTPRRYALRTHPDREPPPAVAKHLLATMDRMCARGRQRPQYWVPPETWHARSLDRPALLVPRIARTLKPIRMRAGILAINHQLSIVAAGEMDLESLERVLSSPDADAWVKAHAGRLDNGFYSLTTTLLRQLPIPDRIPCGI